MSEFAYVQELLNDPALKSLLEKSDRDYYLNSILKNGVSNETKEVECSCRLALLLIGLSYNIDKDNQYAENAFRLLKNIQIKDQRICELFENILGYDLKDKTLLYYFYLSSLALFSDKTISARLILNQYDSESEEEPSWEKRVLTGIFKSLIFLIRKYNGFDDIKNALVEINKLQDEQSRYEENYLGEIPDEQKVGEALILMGLYHTSKALTEVAEYLIHGYDYKKNIESEIKRHIDIATNLIPASSRIKDFVQIIKDDLFRLARNSIWNRTGFNDYIKQICKIKSDNHIIELLPSQQKAMRENLFDVYANSIIVQLPTSAGKTLLAEFYILLTKALRRDAKIVYVVPSRALVNQIYFDLRDDFNGLEFNVERTSSVNEIDPTENNFLSSDDVDILVSTPEKLDLLVRRSNPSVDDVSLFIIDEAHTIESGERGAKLELLIAMLRKERSNAKFMLLSPFLRDDTNVLSEWLGGGHNIKIDWCPSGKVVVGLDVTKKRTTFNLLPSAYSYGFKQECNYTIETPYKLTSSGKKKNILEFSCYYFASKGKTELILCKGKTTANKTAQEIFNWIDQETDNDEVRLVKKYIDDEVGAGTCFSECLNKCIAIHHAGLSDETRILIEHLIRQGHISYVCATSTVAEGVNFPISTVYFDTYKRGNNNDMSANDFWNIAGRAGRTMVDDFGKIILPFNSYENIQKGKGIIRESAEKIASVLLDLFENRDILIKNLERKGDLEDILNYDDSFGPLFQYLIHLVNVSSCESILEIEDLFKDSLAYYMLDSERDKHEFVSLCKKIFDTIKNKYSHYEGMLSFSDKTGFSVPSVLKIMGEASKRKSISDIGTWNPRIMFNQANLQFLTDKIRAISELRETHLGTDDSTAPYNPELIAKMIISWVKGEKLSSISSHHPHFFMNEDRDSALTEFITYMNKLRFKASWGLSALEGIVRGNKEQLEDSFIPSYVYYGVETEQALAMRMLGIPRSLSNSLAQIIDRPLQNYSFTILRNQINNLHLNDWDNLKPRDSALSGEEWRQIVKILMR